MVFKSRLNSLKAAVFNNASRLNDFGWCRYYLHVNENNCCGCEYNVCTPLNLFLSFSKCIWLSLNMGKSNKTITKCCPFCELQVAVACKTCPGCKHSFYNAKRMTLSQAALDDSTGPGGRRRTERVKREKPNYYDASEFEKKTKKKRLERSAAEASREKNRSSAQPLKKKRKKKICKSAKEQEEEDPCITLSLEKARQCSIILAELNRKFFTTTWKV